jgi:hypothetical protein
MTVMTKRISILFLMALGHCKGAGQGKGSWAVTSETPTAIQNNIPGGLIATPKQNIGLFKGSNSAPLGAQGPSTSPFYVRTTPDTFSTNCQNLTCVPGLTSLEYLGLGYDLIQGNPRGSSLSGLDPGFRSRVMSLDFVNGYLSSDYKYKVPYGTELKRAASCTYSSESVELSNKYDYKRELLSEADIEVSSSSNVNAKAALPFDLASIGGSLSLSSAFSLSEKTESFEQSIVNQKNVIFEAKALCTEFIANIHPLKPTNADSSFQSALDKLPVPFDHTTDTNVQAYRDFIKIYGTHYVTYLVLGAKHVYSSVFNSNDLMQLRRQNIDVKSKLSFGAQASAHASLLTASASGSVGGSVSNDNKNSDGQETLKSIFSKIIKVDQYDFGGEPAENGNWTEWAKSVIKKPMPISYKLVGIWEMMNNDTQKTAFLDALYYLFNINPNAVPIDTQILKSFHFGVTGPDGTLISDYSYSSNFQYRALLKAEKNGMGGENDGVLINNASYVNFDLVWEGQEQSAVFATSINNLISPSYEDMTGSPIVDTFTASYFTPYGLLPDTLGQASIQFSAFGDLFTILIEKGFESFAEVVNKFEMQKFSFLTATYSSDSRLISGIVHPGGYAVNNNFNTITRFDVSKPDRNLWSIEFVENFQKEPTIVVFPIWFPPLTNPKLKPEQPIDVFVMTEKCTTKKCTVVTGSTKGSSSIERPYLGFSFLAIDGNLTNATGLVHGRVEVPNDIFTMESSWNSTLKRSGYAETWYFRRADEGSDKVIGGVEIIYDKEFAGIPSVIVSVHDSDVPPVIDPQIFMQSVLVEHITRKSAFIKVHANSYTAARAFVSLPLSFSFVVVGPVDAMRN